MENVGTRPDRKRFPSGGQGGNRLDVQSLHQAEEAVSLGSCDQRGNIVFEQLMASRFSLW